MSIALRRAYHHRICQEIIRIRQDKAKNLEYPNVADSGNKSSIKIAWGMVDRLGCAKNYASVSDQTIGDRFEKLTKDRHSLLGSFTYKRKDRKVVAKVDGKYQKIIPDTGAQ